VWFGRRPVLKPEQVAAAVRMVRSAQSLREVASTLDVGHSTIARVLERAPA
jgi:transposase-like protein